MDGWYTSSSYVFNYSSMGHAKSYYSSSELKYYVDSYYNNNLGNNIEYSSKVATGNYFCDAAKVKYSVDFTSGNATMAIYDNYTPDLVCETDGNDKGLLNLSAGLITYDEVVLAGGYFNSSNNQYYLYQNTTWWTMSSAGVNGGNSVATAWRVNDAGKLSNYGTNGVQDACRMRPVINLKADVTATGTGTELDPYVIQ